MAQYCSRAACRTPWHWPPLLAALLLLLVCGPAAARAVDVSEGWQYRWGDSPFSADGVPRWTQTPDAAAWQPIDFPSNPPGRDGRQNVWYRVTLPAGDWRDPVLFVFSVDLIVEVYQDGRRIYHYGEFDANGQGHFIGWPWHAIPLTPASAGKPLYFRVFSNYQDIGLWGEVKVMERRELLHYVLSNSVSDLLIGGFSLLLALLAAVAMLFVRGRRPFLAIALLAASAGGMAIGSCQARLLLFDHALFWDYLAAASYFLTPIAMALLLEHWVSGLARQVYRGLWLFFLGYLLVALALWRSGEVPVSETYPVFDLLFLLALPLLLGAVGGHLRKASREQRAIYAGLVLHALVLVLSMAVAHGLLPWTLIPLSWGALGFSLVIVAASLHEYARTRHALEALNHSLEARVEARTAELQALASQESRRVRLLEFEGGKRRVLEEMTSQLQQCDCLDGALALLSGGLASLCEPIDGALYRQDAQGRACRVAQWGNPATLFAAEQAPGPDTDPGASADPRWAFTIAYQHPRHGCRAVGVLALALPADQGQAADWFDRCMLFQLVKNGVEKINLTLSIVALREALSRYSYEDALTGLKNRRYLDEWLRHEIALAQRNGGPLSLIVCDIDHFKRLNDAYGHTAGDEALRAVAGQLRAIFRQTDIVCRYGGEEFVVVMPTASLGDAVERAEALRAAVRAMSIQHAGQHLGHVTLSAGVATWPEPVDNPQALLQAADKALYLAKEGGRDRVEAAAAPTVLAG